MIIDQVLANAFIERYKNFLLFVNRNYAGSDEKLSFLEKLMEARDYYRDNREVFDEFVTVSGKEIVQIDKAICSVAIDSWIYLRDTTQYSLFIKPDGTVSMAVKGLFQPVRQVVGISGVYIRTGITTLGSDYVCDGLIGNVVQLGKGYRSSYNEAYKDLKERGLFFRHVQE